jgi:hypothetical protein
MLKQVQLMAKSLITPVPPLASGGSKRIGPVLEGLPGQFPRLRSPEPLSHVNRISLVLRGLPRPCYQLTGFHRIILCVILKEMPRHAEHQG